MRLPEVGTEALEISWESDAGKTTKQDAYAFSADSGPEILNLNDVFDMDLFVTAGPYPKEIIHLCPR